MSYDNKRKRSITRNVTSQNHTEAFILECSVIFNASRFAVKKVGHDHSNSANN